MDRESTIRTAEEFAWDRIGDDYPPFSVIPPVVADFHLEQAAGLSDKLAAAEKLVRRDDRLLTRARNICISITQLLTPELTGAEAEIRDEAWRLLRAVEKHKKKHR